MKIIKSWLSRRREAKRLKLETLVSKKVQKDMESYDKCVEVLNKTRENLEKIGFKWAIGVSYPTEPPVAYMVSYVVGPDNKTYRLTVFSRGGHKLESA
jgi:hypothetical protein